MNIKKQILKLLSVLLSFSMAFGSVLPAYATGSIEEDAIASDSQEANYFVSIPKSITLNEDKQAVYSIKVSGNIASNQQVYVSPVDGIEDTEELDFYMEDTIEGSTKQNTVAEINQNKFYWSQEEVLNAYEEVNNSINVSSISAGSWRGTFQIEINLLTDKSHVHSYTETVTKEATCTEDGEKTYACECDDSYTEVIPATGHNYVDNIFGCKNISNGTYAFVQNGAKWTSNNKGIQSSTATSTWEITVMADTEYSFIYRVSSESNYDKLTIILDGTTVVNAISGNGSEITYKTTLTAGTHTLTATYTKDKSTNSYDDCGYLVLNDTVNDNNNHICTVCKNTEEHSYSEEIVKEATCTEDGEKVCTCTVCGKTYTEIIPAYGSHIDEDRDNICDKCGHEHVWKENVDSYSWTRSSKSFLTSSLTQAGNTWRLNYDTTNQYSTVTLNGYMDITVPEDIEYTFSYNSGSFWSDADRVVIYLDDNVIVDFSGYEASGSKSVILTAGSHTMHLCLYKQNQVSTMTYAAVTLNPIEMLNHVCEECDEKEAHNYTEGIIIKEPTCTEKGEKEFICTKCGYSRIEEAEAIGHNYVEGVCDRCGSLNLVTTTIFSASSLSSQTLTPSGGHYDTARLAGTYSPNIEITEDMIEDEYLLLHFRVETPFYSGSGHYSETDGINGSAMLQKYDEETGTWKTIYSYDLSYNGIDDMFNLSQEGSYTAGSSITGIRQEFQLEKGTYRVYGSFSANRSCLSSAVAHYYYHYSISADLCQIEKGEQIAVLSYSEPTMTLSEVTYSAYICDECKEIEFESEEESNMPVIENEEDEDIFDDEDSDTQSDTEIERNEDISEGDSFDKLDEKTTDISENDM